MAKRRLPYMPKTVIYVFGFDLYVKIGLSQDFRKRRISIQQYLPLKLETYLVIPGTRTDEQALHDKFAKYRLHGEWFLFADEIADWVEAQPGGYSKPRAQRRADFATLERLNQVRGKLVKPNAWLCEQARPNPWDEAEGIAPNEFPIGY